MSIIVQRSGKGNKTKRMSSCEGVNGLDLPTVVPVVEGKGDENEAMKMKRGKLHSRTCSGYT